MDKFIHRENVALFRRRLDDPALSYGQREAILRLLREEEARGHQPTPSRGRAPDADPTTSRKQER